LNLRHYTSGTAMFFCPGLVARVPQDYLNDQLKGILATAAKNDLDDDGNYVEDEEEDGGVAINNTDVDVNVSVTAGGALNVSVDLDSPECDGEGVACALLTPLAQIELHCDDVPFLDYIISDIHGHLQVFTGWGLSDDAPATDVIHTHSNLSHTSASFATSSQSLALPILPATSSTRIRTLIE